MAYLAASLVRLRNELNSRWPNRDKTSDGWIGDASHQKTKSDHNPDSKGCVHALDIDKDGIDPWLVVGQAIKHPATQYVIFDRKIWSRTRGFSARAYTGSNPHTMHIHVSIQHTSGAENAPASWLGSGLPIDPPEPNPSYPAWPGVSLRLGSKGTHVHTVQSRLRQRGWQIAVDGDFGPETDRVVRAFQTEKHLVSDGIVGPATWKALWVAPIT
jgi:hypothetical protein